MTRLRRRGGRFTPVSIVHLAVLLGLLICWEPGDLRKRQEKAKPLGIIHLIAITEQALASGSDFIKLLS